MLDDSQSTKRQDGHDARPLQAVARLPLSVAGSRRIYLFCFSALRGHLLIRRIMQKLAIEPVWFTSREYLESQYVGHWSLILTECCSETGDQRERREPGRGGISQSFSPFIFSKIFFCAYPTCPAFSIPFLIQVKSTTATHAPAATVPIDVFNKNKQKKREATAVGSCNTRLTDHTLWPHSLTTLSLTHATTVDDGGCRQGVNIKGRTIWPPPLTFQTQSPNNDKALSTNLQNSPATIQLILSTTAIVIKSNNKTQLKNYVVGKWNHPNGATVVWFYLGAASSWNNFVYPQQPQGILSARLFLNFFFLTSHSFFLPFISPAFVIDSVKKTRVLMNIARPRNGHALQRPMKEQKKKKKERKKKRESHWREYGH